MMEIFNLYLQPTNEIAAFAYVSYNVPSLLVKEKLSCYQCHNDQPEVFCKFTIINVLILYHSLKFSIVFMVKTDVTSHDHKGKFVVEMNYGFFCKSNVEIDNFPQDPSPCLIFFIFAFHNPISLELAPMLRRNQMVETKIKLLQMS